MSQKRTLFLLILILAIVISIGLIQGIQPADQKPTPTFDTDEMAQAQLRQINQIFPDVQLEDVFAINILDPVADLALTLTRTEDDLWTVIEVPNLLAQNDADAVAWTMANLPYINRLAAIEQNQVVELGLTEDDATLLLSVILKDNTQHVIAVGDLDPTASGFYALVDDRPELYLLDGEAIAYLVYWLRQAYEPVSPEAEP